MYIPPTTTTTTTTTPPDDNESIARTGIVIGMVILCFLTLVLLKICFDCCEANDSPSSSRSNNSGDDTGPTERTPLRSSGVFGGDSSSSDSGPNSGEDNGYNPPTGGSGKEREQTLAA